MKRNAKVVLLVAGMALVALAVWWFAAKNGETASRPLQQEETSRPPVVEVASADGRTASVVHSAPQSQKGEILPDGDSEAEEGR